MLLSLRPKRWALAAPLLMLLAWLALPAHLVLAGSYGQGGFGACAYRGCVTTQATLPSGLRVSVDLSDGQAIPKSGYTIIVTPLNGAGTSFSKVAFYVDGVLAQTVIPDETAPPAGPGIPQRCQEVSSRLLSPATTTIR